MAVIDDRYEVLCDIEQGSSGRVVAAIDTKNNQLVAIKINLPGNDPSLFKQEA